MKVSRLEASTRTVADAATAVGCDEAEIAKSIVFVADGDPVVCVASGRHRVDVEKVADALDVAEVRQAQADEVRAATGFAIGGVAPVGHTGPVRIFIDADLDQYDEIWAAAGSPNAVFRLTPADLRRVTGGQVIAVK
jgi:Cys-tRNA(Pro) deacylase